MKRLSSKLLGAALLALLIVAAGCDSNDEDDSEFARFEGSWSVTSLKVQPDGALSDITARLFAEYETVVFTFIDSDTRGRRFNLVGDVDNGENLVVGGDLQLDANDAQLILLPDAFSAEYVGDYEFMTSTRLELFLEDQYGGQLLDLLFEGDDYGEFVEVQVTLERPGLTD